jgi:hypothetical protein
MQQSLLGVFGERDDSRRTAAAEETYTDQVTFTDPEGEATGRPALLLKAAALLEGAPGFVFRAAGPVREAGDLGLLQWHFGPEGQPPS